VKRNERPDQRVVPEFRACSLNGDIIADPALKVPSQLPEVVKPSDDAGNRPEVILGVPRTDGLARGDQFTHPLVHRLDVVRIRFAWAGKHVSRRFVRWMRMFRHARVVTWLTGTVSLDDW